MRLATLACAAILIVGTAHAKECPPGQVLRNGECVVGYHHHRFTPHAAPPPGPVSPPTPPSTGPHVTHDAAPRPAPVSPPTQPSTGGEVPRGTGGSTRGPYYGYGYHPSPGTGGSTGTTGTPSAPPRPDIRETGYAALFEAGKETPGYGLYSYAILAFPSDKSAALLAEIIKSTLAASQLSIDRKNINVLYVPITNGKQDAFIRAIHEDKNDLKKLGNDIDDIYDFGAARKILDHVCAHPPGDMEALCHADTSSGPYIFTYTAPATSLDNYPPPYLFVDFTRVPEGAFPEWLSAYRSQVKQKDIHDGTWVESFRLEILNYAMMAAGLINPVEGSVKDTIESFIHSGKAEDNSTHSHN